MRTTLAVCALAALAWIHAGPATGQEPGESFSDALQDGGPGPEMVVIPAGSFEMGCVSGEECYEDEMPVRTVTIARPFAVSKHEINFGDFDRFAAADAVDDAGWGRGRQPVVNVSWNEAKEYVAWLSSQTGRTYRLLTEAEWEYAARAGSTTQFTWGSKIGQGNANCGGCATEWDYYQTAPVGSFAPNAFGLHDVHGNVWEWVEDCWNGSYEGAPSDGSAWLSGDCSRRILRGGSYDDFHYDLRSAVRFTHAPDERNSSLGFRVARTLDRSGPDAMPATWEEFLSDNEWMENAKLDSWEDWEPMMQQMPPLEPGCMGVLIAGSLREGGEDVYLPREYFEQPPGKRVRDPNWTIHEASGNSG